MNDLNREKKAQVKQDLESLIQERKKQKDYLEKIEKKIDQEATQAANEAHKAE